MNKIVCPVCESKFSLEQAVREGDLREMAEVAARFGKGWKVAWEYVECFRRSHQSTLTLGRRLMLLKEALVIYVAEEFDLEGKRYRVPAREVGMGMWKIVKMDKVGLQNQNYLKKVLVESAERVSAEGLTAREERKRSEPQGPDSPACRSGRSLTEVPGEEKIMSAAEYKRRQGLSSLAAAAFKDMG